MSMHASIDKEHEVTLTAPRRFKSAFIFYSSERHKEIKEELAEKGLKEKTTNIAKMVSKEWHEMTPEEREFWEEKSKDDQYRYSEEMMAFHEAQARSKLTKRDPNAPKRPMSAFLAFSNRRRATLKRGNPSLTNADLSKVLSQMWKEAPPELKKGYIDQEAHLRAQYKEAMVAWRKNKKANSALDPGPLESAVASPLTSSWVEVSVNTDNAFLTQHPNRWNRSQQPTPEMFFFPIEQSLDYAQQVLWQSQQKMPASTNQQNTECAELLELYKQPISNIHFENDGDRSHEESSIFL